MILPNLFVPGAAKSATSSFHEYLFQHPQIYMSKIKEPHFFSTDSNFQADSAEKLQEYSKLFVEGKEFLLRGESSTGYMVFPHVIERIQEHIPDPRFIFVLRNPVDRAYSHYWWLYGKGFETRSFRNAILADMYELPDPEKTVNGFRGYRYYFAFGKYATYLKKFISKFGEAKVCVVTTDQIEVNLIAVMNYCFDFLKITRLNEISSIKSNQTVIYKHPGLYRLKETASYGNKAGIFLKKSLSGKMYKYLVKKYKSGLKSIETFLATAEKYPPMSDEDRQWLCNLYNDEVYELRKITNLSFDKWMKDFPYDRNV